MVEGGGLEIRCGGNVTVGSNPSSSPTTRPIATFPPRNTPLRTGRRETRYPSCMSKTKTYSGESIDVGWNESLCIHLAECGRSSGELFVGKRQPWCQPDLVAVDDVVSVVKRCSSGALSYTRKDGRAGEAPAERNEIVVSSRGPLYATGDLHLTGAPEDRSGVRFRAALCRCGQSKNKPFCDNTHEASGFSDHGAIGQTGDGFESEGGPLTLKPVKDGPLLVSGNLTLVAGTGRCAWRGTKAALCRCGASKNKPFCDGSHKAAGFQAE